MSYSLGSSWSAERRTAHDRSKAPPVFDPASIDAQVESVKAQQLHEEQEHRLKDQQLGGKHAGVPPLPPQNAVDDGDASSPPTPAQQPQAKTRADKGAQSPTNGILQKTQSILNRAKNTLAKISRASSSRSHKSERSVTGNAAFLKDAASSATALTADRSHSKSKAAAVASQSGAESDGSASSSTAASVQILDEYEATASSQVSEDSKSDAREGDTLESSSSAESSAMSASVASKDAASDEDMADLSQSSVVSTATSSSSASPPSHKTASRKKHHKLSRVDRQLRAVSKLCNADFRDELRSAVHGRSHAPMPKLAAVAAAVIKLREAAELNAEKQKSKESDGGGKRKHAHEAVDLSKFEFGCFDLFGTVDGILWKIFSEIGFVERKAVALVSETEWRHAVMNLVVFADFKAIIVGTSVDSHNDAEAALAHPSLPKGLLGSRVSLVDEFASKDNVNHIISCLTALRLPRQPVHCTDKGMSGSIDLLLMDVGGGMDYWILSQIKEVQPRVVVLKILPEMSTQAIPLVRPYKLDYTSTLRADRGIPILTVASWAKKNGYRVVGCDSDAVHAFLLLDGVGDAVFPSIDLHTCSPKVPTTTGALKEVMSAEWKSLDSLS